MRKQLVDEKKHLKADSRRALVASKKVSSVHFHMTPLTREIRLNVLKAMDRNLSYNWVPR